MAMIMRLFELELAVLALNMLYSEDKTLLVFLKSREKLRISWYLLKNANNSLLN